MEGNNKAMREALSEIVLLTAKAGKSIGYDVACGIIASIAKHALKQPSRNCDVGTAEEQEERYKASTDDVYHTLTLTNALRWAQMPYEGGAK